MSCLLWLLFPFMEFSVNGKKILKVFPTRFAPLFHLNCYSQSSYFNFLHSLQFILFLTSFNQLPSLNQKKKVTCENCGNQTTEPNLVRHKKNCSAGTSLYSTQCPNFSAKSRDDLSYQTVKNYNVPGPPLTYKCKQCQAEFTGFYALRQHKNTQHGTKIWFGASNFNVEDIVGEVDDQSLREELESCKQFLADTE